MLNQRIGNSSTSRILPRKIMHLLVIFSIYIFLLFFLFRICFCWKNRRRRKCGGGPGGGSPPGYLTAEGGNDLIKNDQEKLRILKDNIFELLMFALEIIEL